MPNLSDDCAGEQGGQRVRLHDCVRIQHPEEVELIESRGTNPNVAATRESKVPPDRIRVTRQPCGGAGSACAGLSTTRTGMGSVERSVIVHALVIAPLRLRGRGCTPPADFSTD